MTATSYLSNYAGNLALSTLLANGGFLALHLEDPTDLGLLATELAGGGYIRQPISFAVPAGKTIVSSNAQTFPGLPVATIPYFAVWDSISAGNMIFRISLVDLGFTPIVTTLGGQVLVPATDIALAL